MIYTDVQTELSWGRGYRLDRLDITANESRPADLLICRDIFIHLSSDIIFPRWSDSVDSAPLLFTTSYTTDSIRVEFAISQRMKEPSLRNAKLNLLLFNIDHSLRILVDS